MNNNLKDFIPEDPNKISVLLITQNNTKQNKTISMEITKEQINDINLHSVIIKELLVNLNKGEK